VGSGDSERAARYALRGMAGTDRLAFRAAAGVSDLRAGRVLDLGCGAGRSSRFVRDLGATVVGVDASAAMLARARAVDPTGIYLQHDARRQLPLVDRAFDGFFTSWMLLELGEWNEIVAVAREAARAIRRDGHGVAIVNSEAFYRGHWLSCHVDFPENSPPLQSGQRVRALLVPEGVEVNDFFWSEEDYARAFVRVGLEIVDVLRPLGRPEDGVEWRDETRLAPYLVFRLRKP